MNLKNNWFLVKVEKVYLRELGTMFLVCTYSNGLFERTIDIKHGESIQTIISYEWMD
jgi:hypothetical protein